MFNNVSNDLNFKVETVWDEVIFFGHKNIQEKQHIEDLFVCEEHWYKTTS